MLVDDIPVSALSQFFDSLSLQHLDRSTTIWEGNGRWMICIRHTLLSRAVRRLSSWERKDRPRPGDCAGRAMVPGHSNLPPSI